MCCKRGISNNTCLAFASNSQSANLELGITAKEGAGIDHDRLQWQEGSTVYQLQQTGDPINAYRLWLTAINNRKAMKNHSRVWLVTTGSGFLCLHDMVLFR